MESMVYSDEKRFFFLLLEGMIFVFPNLNQVKLGTYIRKFDNSIKL